MPTRSQGSSSYENWEASHGGADSVPMGPDTPVQPEVERSPGRQEEQIRRRGPPRVYALGIFALALFLVILAWVFLAIVY